MDTKKVVEELFKLNDYNFAMYQVYSDPIYRKIPVNDIDFIINKSIKCGQKEADKILLAYKIQDYKTQDNKSRLDIYRLIRDLYIKIKEEPGDNSIDLIYFASFEEPSSITLYLNPIYYGEELVEKYKIKELLDIKLKEIILAHEIFHYIEANNKYLFVNQYNVKLWRLGPYTHKSHLISLLIFIYLCDFLLNNL